MHAVLFNGALPSIVLFTALLPWRAGEMEATLRITSSAVFNRVLLFMLKEADGIFRCGRAQRQQRMPTSLKRFFQPGNAVKEGCCATPCGLRLCKNSTVDQERVRNKVVITSIFETF